MEVQYVKGERKNSIDVIITVTLHYPADFNTGKENDPAVKLDILKRLKNHIDKETNQAKLNYEEFKIRNSNQGDLFK